MYHVYAQENRTKRAKLFSSARGFSFIEMIITAALIALVFGGLFSAYETIIMIIGESRMKANALVLTTERIEYIRSLPYAEVGTLGGVPMGALPQNSTVTINGATYNERLLITYVDDPADGLAGADSNGIISDYKLVKVEYSWAGRNGTSTIFHTTNIVPRGIETTAGGGTIRVNVFDALVAPVSGAMVRFVNPTLSIDTSRITGASGEAYLSGAPAGGGYEIYVTRSGYSSDGTYLATVANPSPSTPVVSVLETQVSTMNFQIDRVSQLTVETIEPLVYQRFEDTFSDSTNVASLSNTSVVGGSIRLTDGGGFYPSDGFVQSTFIAPATVDAWHEVAYSTDVPTDTEIKVSVYHNSASPVPVPDSDLPGNSAGFTTSPIDISGLDPAVYPELALAATLNTTDTSITPEVLDWEMVYVMTRVPLSGVPVLVRSHRLIGTGVHKYVSTNTTDGGGTFTLSDMEFGLYDIEEQSGSYTAAEICPTSPLTLAPDSTETITFSLVPAVSNWVRVVVNNGAGTPITDAEVTLERGGYSEVENTSSCGQAFFAAPGENTGYTLTVSKSGYTTVQVNDIEVIAGGNLISVTLVP